MAKEKDPSKIPIIFEATLQLVLQKGFSGLTMAQVAKQAGMATGTLYIYFKSKEDLLNQLYLEVKTQKAHKLVASIQTEDLFYVRFSRLWKAYFLDCYQNPQHMQFVLLFCDSGYISEQTKQQVQQLVHPMIQMFYQATLDMQIVDLPVMAMFGYINGSVHALVRYHLDLGICPMDELLNQYFLICWNGLRK